MAQLEPYRQQIEGSGALVYVAAEKREGMFKPAEFLRNHPISFPFLLDEDRQVTRSYGLYHRLGSDAFNIAHPATLVVGRDRVIRFIYRGEDQRDRAPLEPVLEALQQAK
jgi:peroxiredoxin